MANVFDQLDELPGVFYSGDNLQWKRSDLIADYPLADYSVQYEFRHDADGVVKTADAVEDSGNYVFDLPQSMVAGVWVWAVIVTQTLSARTVTLEGGRLVVKPKPNTAAGLSHAEKMLTRIEAELEARITGNGSANAEYTIDGRSMKRMEITELEMMRNKYGRELNASRRAKSGKSVFKNTVVRLR